MVSFRILSVVLVDLDRLVNISWFVLPVCNQAVHFHMAGRHSANNVDPFANRMATKLKGRG